MGSHLLQFISWTSILAFATNSSTLIKVSSNIIGTHNHTDIDKQADFPSSTVDVYKLTRLAYSEKA
jgi:hypothetical protein